MWTLRSIEFGDLPGWADDDHFSALGAFALQALKPSDEYYRHGTLGVAPDTLTELVKLADNKSAKNAPRRFFEQNFTPFALTNNDGHLGQVTAFYEPVVDAQIERGGEFQTALLRRPDDLLPLDNSNRPKEIDDTYRFGRRRNDGSIGTYFDRSQINAGALGARASVIAYVRDPIEAFFIHIQGAARLKLGDGSIIRITYDGKSGHPFTPIGKLLIQRGEINAGDISMQSIKAWLG
ncbi:MAG: MltA domain-containing protein, partial [Pseudomonadota bacterium]